jgi:hypothetical protein
VIIDITDVPARLSLGNSFSGHLFISWPPQPKQ